MSSSTVDVHPHDPHGHSGAHALDPHQQHHFTTMEQQFDTSKIGMWLFLVTEVLLFGGLFVGFGMMQSRYPREFVEAHEHLQRGYGAFNTMVLLVSSWTMVLAVNAARTNKRDRLVMYLGFTIICALMFLGVKYFEYSDHLMRGEGPSHSTFLAVYFTMTGLHGLHILGGMIVMLYLLGPGAKLYKKRPDQFTNRIEYTGLYWHFVDLVWIFLFPVLYLL